VASYPCRVTGEALFRLTGSRFHTASRVFDSVHLHIENIASTKYDGGFVEEDGTVTVGAADLE
jgi:hypothetical protein